jgi:hypothetical protein
MTTGPDRKFAIRVNDEQKPGVLLGDYVKVSADASPGINRMDGFGFVKEVRGVGTVTIASVKYYEVFGGQLHSEIPFPVITVAIFGQDWQCEDLGSSINRKRKQSRSQMATVPVTPSPVKKRKQNAKQEPVRKEPPAEKIVMRLRTGNWNNKGKGWHCI